MVMKSLKRFDSETASKSYLALVQEAVNPCMTACIESIASQTRLLRRVKKSKRNFKGENAWTSPLAL